MKVIKCDYCEKEITTQMDEVSIDLGININMPTMGDRDYESGEIDLCKTCLNFVEEDIRETFIRGMAEKFMERVKPEGYTCLPCALLFQTKKGLAYHETHNCPHNTIAG